MNWIKFAISLVILNVGILGLMIMASPVVKYTLFILSLVAFVFLNLSVYRKQFRNELSRRDRIIFAVVVTADLFLMIVVVGTLA